PPRQEERRNAVTAPTPYDNTAPDPPEPLGPAMPIRAALFDFDGTLADSFAAITSSTNHVRAGYGLPPLPEAEVRKYVGYGLTYLMADLVPGPPVEEAVARYREHHARVMTAETKLMPGVAETIPELLRRGLCLGVCSNKRVE